MLFFSFFKTLVNHEVTVELKNDISIRGTLKSVDQYLNIKLDDITVVEEMKYPHLVSTVAAHPRGDRRHERSAAHPGNTAMWQSTRTRESTYVELRWTTG